MLGFNRGEFMESKSAVRISYWAIQEGVKIIDPVGMIEFKEELSQSYVSSVHGRPGDLGGGLYEFTIEFLTNISIQDVAKFIAGGVAFDLLKLGTKAFVLRPFIAAYEKLKKKNKEGDVDIHELKFIFQDAEVIVSKICTGSIYDSLGSIFRAISENYEFLKNRDGEFPYTIQIPVFEDPEKTLCRFRVLLDVDETIGHVTSANYQDYWGIYYDFERASRVFDVKRKLLIDEDFLTLDRYWQKWEKAYAEGKL
jgi:hypothetical protein